MGEIKNCFVSYNQAVALEQLGFDGLCLAYYHNGKITGVNKFNRKDWEFHAISNKDINSTTDEIILAPLYSQAFDFFREKYDIHSYIDSTYTTGFYLYEYHTSTKDSLFGFDTYKQAESACLDKLIELCKN